MPVFPEPHTAEWFKALEAFDPQQAAHTRKILRLAGRTDVCGVCGDDPATDYKLTGKNLHADGVATVRLCDDCRTIRTSNLGESYTLL
jgi:hypothetical protein